MINPIIKEAEYGAELGKYVMEAYKDPDIDPDQMMGNMMAALVNSQVIDPDRVQHFYKVGIRKLGGI